MRDAAYEEANARGAALRAEGHAIAARYDPATEQVLVKLSTGQMLTVPVRLVQGLSEAAPTHLKAIVISPSGLGLYFPDLDVDVSVPGLRKGIYGTPKWMSRLAAREGTADAAGMPVTRSANQARSGRRGAKPESKL